MENYGYGDAPPPAKRNRPQHTNIDMPADFYNTSTTPSKVLLITDLPPRAQDPDILEAFGQFGKVAYIVIKRQQKNIALVEFEAIDGATSVLCYTQSNPITLVGQRVDVNFSALEKVPRFGFETDQPNKVLVLFVMNVQFNVNAYTLYDICKAHGTVQRIAIVKRSPNITALVEFESVEQAHDCKYAINGADIYTNCCTLKVEYAKIPFVKISIPDDDHADFTAGIGEPISNRKALIGAPPPIDRFPPASGSYGSPYRYGDSRESFGNSRDYAPRDTYYPPREPYGYGDRPVDRYSSTSYSDPRSFPKDDYNRSVREKGPYRREYREDNVRGVSDLMSGGSGSVLIIGGVDQSKLNCDKLFNLLCMYGNILRVMFMRKKTDLALVEMGNPWQAREAISCIKHLCFLGMDIEVSQSNQNCVNTVNEPFTLPDGTPSFADYTTSRLNRYTTKEFAIKNKPCSPQSSLHWFNAPVDMTEEKLKAIFTEREAPEPIKITLHILQSGSSSAGTAEFNSEREATEALVLSNHFQINTSEGKLPYTIKFAYTKARGHDSTDNNNHRSDSSYTSSRYVKGGR